MKKAKLLPPELSEKVIKGAEEMMVIETELAKDIVNSIMVLVPTKYHKILTLLTEQNAGRTFAEAIAVHTVHDYLSSEYRDGAEEYLPGDFYFISVEKVFNVITDISNKNLTNIFNAIGDALQISILLKERHDGLFKIHLKNYWD